MCPKGHSLYALDEYDNLETQEVDCHYLSVHLFSICFVTYFSLLVIACPTVCVTCAGADGGTPSNERKAEVWKMPENAQTPQRQVHALLGGVSERKTPRLKPRTAAILKRLLHEPLTFTTAKNHNLLERWIFKDSRSGEILRTENTAGRRGMN